MPAPRAILSDLHDFTLDPTVKHESIGIDGRLAHVALSSVAPTSVLDVIDDVAEVITQESTVTEDVEVETQSVEEEHVSSKEDVEVVTEEVVTKVETEKEVEVTENVKAHSNNKKRGDAKKK